MGEKRRSGIRIRAAHGMCPEVMKKEISSDSFQGGSGQLQDVDAAAVGSQEKTSGSCSPYSGQSGVLSSNLSGVMGFARGRMNKSDSLYFSSYNSDYIYFYPALKMLIYYRIIGSDSEAYIDVITLCNQPTAIIFIKFLCMDNFQNRYSGKAINN